MELIGEIKDANLLLDLIHELGKLFYRNIGGNKYEVIYFSGTKAIHFTGELTEEQLKKVKAEGYEVDSIEIDFQEGIVRIVQR